MGDSAQVLGPMIVVTLVYGLGILVAFYVIATAVRRGMRDAILFSETDLKRIVKRGVADALAEHEEARHATPPAHADDAEPLTE